MNFMQMRTEAERKVSAKKGVATRQRNILLKKAAVAEQLIRRDSIEIEINSLKIEREYLKTEATMSIASSRLTGRTLLRESEIVKGGQLWGATTGVYFLIKDDSVVYVGQSVSVFGRIGQHQNNKDFDSIAWIPCEQEKLDQLESLYIHLLTPILNGNLNNGNKSAPLALCDLL